MPFVVGFGIHLSTDTGVVSGWGHGVWLRGCPEELSSRCGRVRWLEGGVSIVSGRGWAVQQVRCGHRMPRP